MNFKYLIIITAITALNVHAENLLENASFEQGGKTPDKWLRYFITPEQAVYGAEAARDSKKGVGFTANSHKYGGGWIYEKMIAVSPGEKYRLSGWIKSNSWGGNSISIAWFGVKNGRPLWKSTNRTKFVNGKKDWTLVSLDVKAPPGVSFAKITAGRKWPAKGAVYFDDISLEKLSGNTIEKSNGINIKWQDAKPAENIKPGKLIAKKDYPVKDWQEMHADAGTLKKTTSTLEIANTSLYGVGWMSKSIAVKPGDVYSFQAKIKIIKAYHVKSGVALIDTSGKVIELRSSQPQQTKLIFRIPAGCSRIRLLLTQSRSSGKSIFSNLQLTKYQK